MQELTEKFLRKIATVPPHPVRDFVDRIDWRDRMVGVKGARGVGKTTLLLQYIRQQLPLTIISYLTYLQETEILLLLRSATKGISAMQKPEKVYLQNPNLFHAVAPGKFDTGSLRETFFYNQLQVNHRLQYPRQGDFLIDNHWTAEVGGKGKGQQQLAQAEHGFVAADDLEIGYQRRVPLWLFGFLY